jgi:hypothetical protein
MHVLGKVLLGFVVVGAIAAIVLTTMTLDVRTYWEQQAADARTAFEEIDRDLQIKQAAHRDQQDTLDRIKESWGNVFMAPNSRPTNPANGAVSIGVGTQQGLGDKAGSRADAPLVHLFNVSPDSSQYLGAFKIQTAQPGSTEAVLSRNPFPDENFPGGTWRVRELIPFDYGTRLLDVYTKQIEADARLQRMEFDVTRLQGQLAASQALLQERVYQLEGDPNLPEGNPVQKAGYVQAIRDALTERDTLMARLHALRVERLLKLESLQQLTAENAQRIARFTEQTTSSTTAPSVSVANPAAAR